MLFCFNEWCFLMCEEIKKKVKTYLRLNDDELTAFVLQ